MGRRRGPAQLSTRNDVGTRFDLGEQDRPDPGSPHRETCGRPSRCASLVPKLGPGQRSPVFGTRPWARPTIELVSDLRPDLRAVRWRTRKETGRRTDDGLVIGRVGGQREERGDGYSKIKLHLTCGASQRRLWASREARPSRGTSWLARTRAARRVSLGALPGGCSGCRHLACGRRAPRRDPRVRHAGESLRKRAAGLYPMVAGLPTRGAQVACVSPAERGTRTPAVAR